jgi:TATA-box binding protein (TBP) (component of TFIID and TFIIIB)
VSILNQELLRETLETAILNAGSASGDCVEILFMVSETLKIQTRKDPAITVQNIVSSGGLKETLNLNGITIGLGLQQVEYDPEQFPGLVYRLEHPDVVLLLFASGKVVITGGTDPSDASKHWKWLIRYSRHSGRLVDYWPLNTIVIVRTFYP